MELVLIEVVVEVERSNGFAHLVRGAAIVG